ncbi:NAD(+) diphosphatase [Agromyces archimandritae]|uniref:NAD(+) diphosphatase n=1 Tax=Agromyces archimandritae TaxID=2781962 RepID=UPI001FD4932E|nr:NAD(+) diphosphatase [Agromyces archimandritae]
MPEPAEDAPGGATPPAPHPPLARTPADRDAEARTEEAGEAFASRADARVLAMHAGRVLQAMRVGGRGPELELRHPSALPDPELRVYLGRLPGGEPLELGVFGDEAARRIEPEPARWVGVRGAELPEVELAFAVEALGLANWHRSHASCPRCGAPTEPVQRGWARRCPAEDALVFPRTDPAIITLVTDDEDRVLLGSNAMWEPNRYSLLAGFVEPGESLESAVAREIREEAGIGVDRIAYVASQPWPFPASLMLGFTARVPAGADAALARPDGEEILSLRWFSRAELASTVGEVTLPDGTSIARWMLERWFGGPIPDAPGAGE